jgi:hypothetical protein
MNRRGIRPQGFFLIKINEMNIRMYTEPITQEGVER